ncbi:MAG: hypothetical protein ISR48_11585 [Alphaproteobacteria bacterium]|nr:hypothetical protein [Alphaproteobacteria bacterium]
MPKTDVKKIESEDVRELSDEALDRATGGVQSCPITGGLSDYTFAPAE